MATRKIRINSLVLAGLVMMMCIVACSDDKSTPPSPSVPPSMSISDLQTSDCSNIQMPVTVQKFVDIAGLEMHITYDPQQMTYDSVTSLYLSGMITNATNSTVHIIWADISNLVSVPDGETLVTIHFSDLTGISNLTFNAETEIVDYEGNPIDVEFTDGSVECTAK